MYPAHIPWSSRAGCVCLPESPDCNEESAMVCSTNGYVGDSGFTRCTGTIFSLIGRPTSQTLRTGLAVQRNYYFLARIRGTNPVRGKPCGYAQDRLVEPFVRGKTIRQAQGEWMTLKAYSRTAYYASSAQVFNKAAGVKPHHLQIGVHLVVQGIGVDCSHL